MPSVKILATDIYWLVSYWNVESVMSRYKVPPGENVHVPSSSATITTQYVYLYVCAKL